MKKAFWYWLKAIGRNAARDGGRKQRRYLALLEKFAFRDTGSPKHLNPDDMLGALDECLQELSPCDHQLISGKYLHGFTVSDLARESGLTEKAVESRLLRLRRALAEMLLKKLRTP
jgi:RNA polymerase sigma factor (sigma-70 family)